jgi:cell division protein FtsB
MRLRSTRLRPTRILALCAIVGACLLYWKPLHAYMHTRDVLDRRQGEVARLQQQQQQLQGRIDTVDSGHVLVREARRLGLVKPGERLYIVRGIPAWRKKH